MMRRTMLAVFLVLAAATAQGAQTLTRDGVTKPGDAIAPTGSLPWILVNDGSFEFGECDLGSAWTCTSTTSCSWIINPYYSGWGYPAYDGQLVAWLGGFCDGVPNANSFCQDLWIDGWGAWWLSWHFMGYVNGACSTVRITVNGQEAWRHTMQAQDHTYGTWSQWGETVGVHLHGDTLCFEWEACPDGVDNDNMLIDYLTVDYWVWDGDDDDVATAASSFSVVKSLY
jgi:hypothetical protein